MSFTIDIQSLCKIYIAIYYEVTNTWQGISTDGGNKKDAAVSVVDFATTTATIAAKLFCVSHHVPSNSHVCLVRSNRDWAPFRLISLCLVRKTPWTSGKFASVPHLRTTHSHARSPGAQDDRQGARPLRIFGKCIDTDMFYSSLPRSTFWPTLLPPSTGPTQSSHGIPSPTFLQPVSHRFMRATQWYILPLAAYAQFATVTLTLFHDSF